MNGRNARDGHGGLRKGSEPLDPHLAMIECRLQRHPAPAAPPFLRHRVLMAVDDVLSARPRRPWPDHSATIPRWAWAGAAVIAVMLTWPMATLPGTSLAVAGHDLGLSARLQAAGIPAEDLVTNVTSTEMRIEPGHDLPTAAARSIPTDPSIRRGFDARQLLQELL